MLVPSLACPASCAYCFGPHKGSGTMSRETLGAVVEWQRDLGCEADGDCLDDDRPDGDRPGAEPGAGANGRGPGGSSLHAVPAHTVKPPISQTVAKCRKMSDSQGWCQKQD